MATATKSVRGIESERADSIISSVLRYFLSTNAAVILIIRERVTTISIELGRTLSPEDMIPQLIEGFRKALGARLIEEKPSPSEERLAEKYAEKYRSVEWNYKR